MARRLSEAEAVQLGARLKEARLAAGLTQTQVAAGCGAHHSQVVRCEQGSFRMLRGNVQRMCTLLSIDTHIGGQREGAEPDLQTQLSTLLMERPAAAPALRAILDALRSAFSAPS